MGETGCIFSGRLHVVLLSGYPSVEKDSVQLCGELWSASLPITLSFRPRKGVWKLIGRRPLVDLNIEDPILHDKELPKLEAIKKMQQDTYHIMRQMNETHPGDPTYNTDQNWETYQKTM